jgi:cardiolipin synthase
MTRMYRCAQVHPVGQRLVVRVALGLAVGLALSACRAVPGGSSETGPPALLLGTAATVQVGADEVTLLRSGPSTFAALRALIDAARVRVDVEVYEFARPDLADAVIAARGRGIDVTVIDDPAESNSGATVARLRAAGVDVLDYPIRRLMIDHVKLLVVDSSVAIVGGINWGTRSAANHDYDALLRGPVVTNLERVFIRDLVTCGRSVSVPATVADPAILVAATLPGTEIRPLALDLIKTARVSLSIELFVLTDTGVVRALEVAHARGVEIRLLLDPSQRPSDAPFAALRAAGVDARLYRSRGELLHAKAIVADGHAILFGSANWSGGGFARNHEVDIEIVNSPAVASAMLAQMALNWAASA